MSEECSQSCGSCAEECGDRKVDFLEQPHELSRIKKVIGVVSGKGGVGKSMVTSLMAVSMKRRGYNTAILDADITGPSIPKAFGINEKALPTELGLFPISSKTGIEIMSINLLLEHDTDPVVWRGPVIANTVKQFWTDVIWGDVDYMFVDMPPGTGDVPLTVFQSLPVDGIIIVTSPQELVSMIVAKAVKMARMMKIPVIGLVENMSYFECPDCDKKHYLFGESRIEEVAKQYGIDVVAKMPIDSSLAGACDKGLIELFENNWLDDIVEILEKSENPGMPTSPEFIGQEASPVQ
nr:Mrp/NBP35 family ATP-binding protein [uncultured Acetobacterium sp.]